MPVQLGSAFGRIIIDASQAIGGVNKAAMAVGGVERQFGGLSQKLGGIGRQLTTRVSLPLLGLGTMAVKTATDFGAGMAKLDIAARKSGTGIGTLREAAIAVGADTRLVGISASEAAEAMTNFYKAGMTTTDVFGDVNAYLEEGVELSGAMRAAVDLQAASSLDLAQASDLVAIAMATFGLDADEATQIADDFVQAADASVAEVGDLAAALVNVGPTAAQFGWSLRETNTALALLSERGIRGAEAGTALRSMMTNMLRDTDDVTEAWTELGVALYNADGTMRPLQDIMADLEGSLAGMTDKQRDYYVLTLAGTYGQKAMNTLLTEGADGWQGMADAMDDAATAQDVASRLTDTFKGSIEALMGNLETLLIQVGQPLIDDFLRPLAEHLVNVVARMNEADPATLKWVTALGLVAAAAGPVLIGISGVTSGVGALIRVGGGIATAIGALPGILSSAGVGLQLLAQGESVAAVASLGLQAALGPLALALAAVAAVAGVVYFGMKRVKQVQERTAEVADEWTQFLHRQVEEGRNATEIAEAYRVAQGRVNEAYEKGGLVAKVFINKQKVMNADAEELSQTLYRTADGYDEYYEACRRVGLITEGASGELIAAEQVLTETQYAARRAAEAYGDASTEIEHYGYTVTRTMDQTEQDYLDATGATKYWAEETIEAHEEVVEAYSGLERRASDFFRDLAEMEEDQREEREQTADDHNERLAQIEENHEKRVQQILEGGQAARRRAAGQGSEERLLDLKKQLALEETRLAEYNERTKASTIMAKQERIAELRDEIVQEIALIENRGTAGAIAYRSATQAQLAEAVVAKDEAIALEEERYAEELRIQQERQAQQREEAKRHLGELLLDRLQYWVEAGNLTAEEGAKLGNAIMEQYGLIDEASLETWRRASKAIDDFATGVTTSLDVTEIRLGRTADAIDEIGDKQDTLSETEKLFEKYGREIPEYLDETETSVSEMAGTFETNMVAIQDTLTGTADQAETDYGRVRTEADLTGEQIVELWRTGGLYLPQAAAQVGQYAADAESDLGQVQTVVADTKAAIEDLPSSKTIEIKVNYSAPEEMLLQSPHFAFQNALEAAVRFARHNPIEVAANLGAQLKAGMAPLPAPTAAPAVAGGAGGGGVPTIPEGLVHVDRVGDQIDVHELAYLVAQEIQRRGLH